MKSSAYQVSQQDVKYVMDHITQIIIIHSNFDYSNIHLPNVNHNHIPGENNANNNVPSVTKRGLPTSNIMNHESHDVSSYKCYHHELCYQ